MHQTWFAPYVDVTLTPTYQFQSPADDPARQSVLGFVVAGSKSDCAPSWGGAYTLTAASQQLAVGARIAQLQQSGAQAVVSFGGQANTSLDVACPTAAALTSAYQSVLSAYHLTTIDLDVEGAALDDFAAGQRRAAAVAALEKASPALSVWLTLPVEPSGLQDNALSVIKSMLRDHVSIAGVNVMTMDFTTPPSPGGTMAQLAESALNATHGQLAALFPEYGIRLSAQQIWQRVGATPMIGQNDKQGENFTVSDARALAGFASRNHLGRVSMWSVNRDTQCGTSFSETGMLSNTCSGTEQSGLEFSQVFGQLPGNAAATSERGQRRSPPWRTPTRRTRRTRCGRQPPATRSATRSSRTARSTRRSGTTAATTRRRRCRTPGRRRGSCSARCFPATTRAAIATLPAGTYPAWSVGIQYQAGDKVLYQGLPYAAKWSNQGVSPATESSDPTGLGVEGAVRHPGRAERRARLGPSLSPPTPTPDSSRTTAAYSGRPTNRLCREAHGVAPRHVSSAVASISHLRPRLPRSPLLLILMLCSLPCRALILRATSLIIPEFLLGCRDLTGAPLAAPRPWWVHLP